MTDSRVVNPNKFELQYKKKRELKRYTSNTFTFISMVKYNKKQERKTAFDYYYKQYKEFKERNNIRAFPYYMFQPLS